MSNAIIDERINSVIRFFLCVLIFWLPYSPAVIESCVVICLILWILKRGITRRLNLPVTFLNKPIFFFLIACILSALSSVFWWQSFPNFLTKTLEWFIVYFLVLEVITEKKHIQLILGIFLFTAFSTVLDSLIQYHITNKDIFLGHTIIPGSRATAGFKTANGLGAYLTLVVPFVFALIFLRKNFWYRLLRIVLFSIGVWSLAVTFSHGAWAAVFLAIVFFMLFLLFHKQPRQFYFLLTFFFILFIVLVYFGFILAGQLDLESLRYSTASWRLNVWRDTLGMIKDSPLLGHGINTFMALFEIYRTDTGGSPTYAHNSYLQLTAETGLIGLTSFLWILVALFRWVFACLKNYDLRNDSFVLLIMGLLSGIGAFLFHSFFDNNFYSLQLSMYLWFMIGILVVMIKSVNIEV